jgi:hypothetical protein
MPPIIKQFSGILNTDDSQEVINPTHHKFAKNLRFRGDGKSLRAEGIEGNTLITNTYLPANTNECIGAFYDELKQRIFWFNFNSGSLHGIYQYTISTGVIARIALVGYNTDGDILGFTLNGSIYNVKILYGDTVQGDTLYFNNSQKQPCQINIDRALSGGYGTIKRSFINVIKAPPILPPALTYENDNTVTVNNLRKKLFKFKVRFVYSNKEKSVWSSQGELPLPTNYTDTAIDKEPTKNCRIALILPTGEADVSKIEIAAAINSGNTFLDYLLVKTIDKAASGIANNDLTVFRFYNDQAYTPIDVLESIQTFDLVPLEANALELLNGNIPVYGGIKEGFNTTTILGSSTSSSTPQYTTQPPFAFAASQSGDSGFGTGNIHAVLVGSVSVGDTFNIYTTGATITFVATVATTANVITGLSAAAITAGFTVVSSDTENLVITKTNEVLQRVRAVPVLISISDSFVYDWNSRYSFALTYFDKEGRTIGAETNATLPVQTVNYTETAGVPNIPKISLSISSRPPLNAFYYQICRTKNLSKLKTFYWVSDRTYKDALYAYISIENLNIYIKNNPSSAYLAYSSSANDRIRFLKVLSGTVNTIYTNQDFDIQGQVFNPLINGVTQEGQFLKIALPATTGTFDFGTGDFFNYFINLYTPAESNSEGLDLYYEYGERYTIGNAGTSNAYHQGMLQNQTSNLATPATFEFTKGDDYLRRRTINTGAEYIYKVVNDEEGVGRLTVGLDYYSSTYTDANITTGNSPLQSLSGWTIGDPTRWILKITTGTFNFRLKGTLDVTFSDFGESYGFYFANNLDQKTWFVPIQDIAQGSHSFPFDVTLSLTTGQRLYILGYSVGDFTNSKTFTVSDFTITRELPFTQTIIDQNFSDYFQSAVNSNATAGRSYIVDVNAQQVFNPTLIRWGLAYVPNTNINQTNRFRDFNFDEIDRAKGQIQRFKVRDRILRVFQERGCANIGIYAKFLQDSGNTNILSTTDDIITKNNVQYYEGVYGIGTQVTSLVSSKNSDYFVDPIRGYHVRLGKDGLDPISEIHKGQFYIQPLFIPYNNNYLRANGATAKILGYYNYAEEEYITLLQGGTLGGNTIADYAFSFNEKRRAYCSFYDFNPEWMLSANDVPYSFKAGNMYIHNNTITYTNYYGVQYYPSITLVFNDKEAIKKKFLSVGYQSNQIFVSPTNGDINTGMINSQTGLAQISQLLSVDYDLHENIRTATLLKDANSGTNAQVALVLGDELGGNWIEIKFVYLGSSYSWIYLPYVNYIISNRLF